MKKSKRLLVLAATLLLVTSCGGTDSTTNSDTGTGGTTDTSSVVTVSFDVPTSLSVEVDKTVQINVTNLVGITISEIQYSSFDNNIARVSADGVVSGVSEGETKILVKGQNIRKTIDITVTDSNKLNNLVSFRKLKAIAGLDADSSSVDYTGALAYNIAWDGGTYESTSKKFDFDGTAQDQDLILRGGHVKDTASIDNGDYVIVMSNGGDSSLTADTQTDEVQTMVYSKTSVSEWANSFRLWGWASKSDLENSLASGKGKFRVAAYEFNEDYSILSKSTFLKAKDIGTLVQDEKGWITFDDVSDVNNGTIAGAPADNMFVFETTTADYDLKGKEIILSIETANYANQSGANNENIPNRFGIKRMGFMCDPKPDIQITSEKNVSLYPGETTQIVATGIGDAENGTFSYESSNPAVASVNETGLVTAHEVSNITTATITITNDRAPNKEASVTITVSPTPDVNFDVESSITMKVGEEKTITPTNVVGEGEFAFTSSSNSIATVDSSGKVTAVNVGKVLVSVQLGELIKKVEVNVSNTDTIVGVDNNVVKEMAKFENTGGFPAAWDFAWSGGVTAEKIDADDTKLETPLIHMARTSKEGDTLTNVVPNDIEIISNIGGIRSDIVAGQVFVKTDISADAGSFRLWGRAPTANTDMGGTMKTRIVVYIPNSTYTNYQAYVLPLAAADGGHTMDMVSNDQVSGIVTLTSDNPGGFLVFGLPEEVKGATGAIVSIESYSCEGTLQTREYVRRFGFDA